MSLPQMYQPTATEIAAVAASAARRHPALASRIGKATDILAGGSLQLDAVAWEKCQLARWSVASQSHGGSYVITNGACPCSDKRVKHCKHVIATSLLTKILNNRLNSDIQARMIDLAILPDSTLNCYAPKLGFVHVRKLGSAYVFCDASSMVRYSIWAAAQLSVNWTAPTLVWAGHSVNLVAA